MPDDTTSSSSPTSDLLQDWLGMWTAFPKSFSQPILPGWTFGNVIVDENNSSAPDTERSIVSSESYGRQIGKLMDAVYEMIEAEPRFGNLKACGELKTLKKEIDEIKRAAARRRIEQFTRDLETVDESERAEVRKAVATIRKAFPTLPRPTRRTRRRPGSTE